MPTEHPLAIVAGAVLSLFGDAGDRVWVALIIARFLWLIAGVYRLGRIAFTPLVGGVAAALLLTRFDFAFLTARGYIDIPYMAMVVWAAALEARAAARAARRCSCCSRWPGCCAPRRGCWRPCTGAGSRWPASWRQRALYAVLAAVGPAAVGA